MNATGSVDVPCPDLTYLVGMNGQHSDEPVAGSGEDGVLVQRQQAVDRLGVPREPVHTYTYTYEAEHSQ